MTEPRPSTTGSPRGKPPEPRVHPSSPVLLVAAGLVAAAGGWVLFDKFYGELPSLPLTPGAILVVFAIVEGIVALTTRRWIERRPRSRPISPLAVARFVAVAKASSAAGALFTGAYAGALAFLVPRSGEVLAAAADVLPAAVGAFGAVLFLAAALWLEHSCRIPPQPDDDESPRGTDIR